ncbi:4Fe-4S dicluster domain-containing protein [Flexivirga sp.]|uniref:4Fe-4S dicluster domain-containing protein n=1 Tax=Flexivirga sp. TaxID=1962927 RepID=UPI003F7F7AAA
MSSHRLFGPLDPAADAGWDQQARKGFLTDTSVCIGCKACEVACKEWNAIPADLGEGLTGDSYDNTGALGADTWRHVAFIEQTVPAGPPTVDLGMPSVGPPADGADAADDESGARPDFRWLMSSDVCKHCTHAACLDVCPTGSLFRTEFGTVVVQEDVCNGCGYCVPACPYGVIERRGGGPEVKNAGIAQKCTLCYDRIGVGDMPACAKACPTESSMVGAVDELRERGRQRVAQLQEQGVDSARLYGADPQDGVGGTGAMFLLLDEPEVYGLPPDPVVTTRDLPMMWQRAGLAAAGLATGAVLSFLGARG